MKLCPPWLLVTARLSVPLHGDFLSQRTLVFHSCRNESSQTQCCMTTHIDSLTVLGSGSCTGLVGRTQEGQGRAVPRLQGEPSPASRGAASLVTAPSLSSRPAAWPVHLSDPDPPASPL